MNSKDTSQAEEPRKTAPCADEVKTPEKITMGISQMELETLRPGPVVVTLFGPAGIQLTYEGAVDLKYDDGVFGFTCPSTIVPGGFVRIESSLPFGTCEELKTKKG